MAEIEGKALILCMRVEAGPSLAPSTKVMGDCGHEVWVADSSVTTAYDLDDRHEIFYSCMTCGVAALSLDKKMLIPDDMIKLLTKHSTPEEIEHLHEVNRQIKELQ